MSAVKELIGVVGPGAGEDEIPSWLHYSEADLAEAIAATSKQRPK